MNIKKSNILVLLSAIVLSCGCSQKQDLVSLYDMECSQLLAQEVKAQEKYKSIDKTGIVDLIGDIISNSPVRASSTPSQSEIDANEAKQELREIQSVIHSKKCR
jgi:hypothetical protein